MWGCECGNVFVLSVLRCVVGDDCDCGGSWLWHWLTFTLNNNCNNNNNCSNSGTAADVRTISLWIYTDAQAQGQQRYHMRQLLKESEWVRCVGVVGDCDWVCVCEFVRKYLTTVSLRTTWDQLSEWIWLSITAAIEWKSAIAEEECVVVVVVVVQLHYTVLLSSVCEWSIAVSVLAVVGFHISCNSCFSKCLSLQLCFWLWCSSLSLMFCWMGYNCSSSSTTTTTHTREWVSEWVSEAVVELFTNTFAHFISLTTELLFFSTANNANTPKTKWEIRKRFHNNLQFSQSQTVCAHSHTAIITITHTNYKAKWYDCSRCNH